MAFHAASPAETAGWRRPFFRWLIDGELCAYRHEHYFIRGLIDIPIIDSDEVFTWGVWVSQSEASAQRAIDTWETEGREHLDPAFGWLMTELPYDQSTVLLQVMVHNRAVGLRPLVVLEPTDHLLALEQRVGITLKRASALGAAAMHAGRTSPPAHQ